MSTSLKTLIIGIIVVAAFGFGWSSYVNKKVSDINGPGVSDLKRSNTAPNPVSDGSPALSSAKDVSNSALDKDLTAIDSQLGALNGDSASVDQGLNDKPMPQAE